MSDSYCRSRVCCATCFWSQTEVSAQEFDRIKKRHQKQTHSGPELCQQFAACMYLCSTLRLAWGGKFCCCQSLIDDLQPCLANRNTFFFLFAMIEVQHQKQIKVEMILKSSCSWCSPWCFQGDWNMCVCHWSCCSNGSLVFSMVIRVSVLSFLPFTHLLESGKRMGCKKAVYGCIFSGYITLSFLWNYCFLLHRGSLFCFMLCVATAWKINDFCCQCSMKYHTLGHLIHVAWLWILTAKQCPSRYQQVFVHQVESHVVSGIVLLVSMFYIPAMSFLCTMCIYANKFV